MPKGEQSAPGPREAIRAAAIRLFAEKGYSGASTREICRDAGVTKPVLYYHFGSKEGLYRSVTVETTRDSLDRLRLAAARARDARGKLIATLAEDFTLTRRDPATAHLLFRLLFAPRGEAAAADCLETGLQWLELIEGIVREGVRKRELRGKPREIAEALLGVQVLYTMGYLLLGEPELDAKLARRIVDLMLKGCGNRTGRWTKRRS